MTNLTAANPNSHHTKKKGKKDSDSDWMSFSVAFSDVLGWDTTERAELRTMKYGAFKYGLLTGSIWAWMRFTDNPVDWDGMWRLLAILAAFDYGYEEIAYQVWNKFKNGDTSRSSKVVHDDHSSNQLLEDDDVEDL